MELKVSSEFIKDFVRYIPSKILPACFYLAFIPLVTRILSPSEFGYYTLIMTSVTFLSVMATDWISPSVIRFYPEYEASGPSNPIAGTMLRLSIASVLIVLLFFVLLTTIARNYIEDELFQFFTLGLLLFVLTAFFNIFLHFLVARRLPNLYSLFSVWRYVICLLIGLFISWYFGWGTSGLLLGVSVGLIIILPYLFFSSFKGLSLTSSSKPLMISTMKYGFPLVGTNIAAWIMALSDRYVIQYARGSHEVGLYSISYSLADRTLEMFISLVILSSAPIAMSKWENDGPEETGHFISNVTRYYLLLALPSFIGVSLVAKPVISILTTEQYFEGYKIMAPVAAGIFLFGLQRNFQLGLLFHKKTGIILIAVLISGFVNIVLNILLVPIYGFIAAGYTTLISYSVYSLIIIYVSKRYFIWPFPWPTLYRTALSTIAMAFVVLAFFRLTPFEPLVTLSIAIISGAITYYIFLKLTGELGGNSISNIFPGNL